MADDELEFYIDRDRRVREIGNRKTAASYRIFVEGQEIREDQLDLVPNGEDAAKQIRAALKRTEAPAGLVETAPAEEPAEATRTRGRPSA